MSMTRRSMFALPLAAFLPKPKWEDPKTPKRRHTITDNCTVYVNRGEEVLLWSPEIGFVYGIYCTELGQKPPVIIQSSYTARHPYDIKDVHCRMLLAKYYENSHVWGLRYKKDGKPENILVKVMVV